MYKTVRYQNITVYYLSNLDGGGRTFGQQYVQVVKDRVGRVRHAFEFCAGPGFIGFSLLAHNLCERLTLADINPEAVEACRQTIKKNKLESKVSVYLSDVLDNIPLSERWDLVVGNPPHWFCEETALHHKDIRLFDPGFVIHQKFYRDVATFLTPSGVVLLQENGRATQRRDFEPMIENNGLRIVEVFKVPHFFLTQSYTFSHVFTCLKHRKHIGGGRLSLSPFYFIWSQLKDTA